MKPTRTQRGVGLAVGTFLAFAVGAAQPQRDAPAATNTGPQTAGAPSEARAAATGNEIRLSKLVGMNVHDRAGHALGEIKDVVIDTNTGEVQYAILSVGGALGIGDKLFAMPLARAKPDGKGKLIADFDRADLKSAPVFDSGRDVDRSRPGTQPDERFRRASNVMKAKVRDSHGGTIGKVDDMVVDVQANRVESVVVKFDRAWTPNDKLVALPMSAFSDGATTARAAPAADASAPPRNPAPPLALLNPSGEPSKGPASAVVSPQGVPTRPPAIEAKPGADVQALERQPLKTMTSYADDENLVFKGTREQLVNAPAFDAKRYPD